MRKLLMFGFVFFILINIAAADKGDIETYLPNEVFDLSLHLTNNSGDVEGATCRTQIRNETYGVIENLDMNDIGEGWYNATYNTSKIGKHFCRQNCTSGSLFTADTCDFIIKGDRNMGVIIFIPLFISAFLLAVSWMLHPEKYWALKLGLMMMGLVFIFQSYHFGVLIAAEVYGSDNIVNELADATNLYGIVFWMIMSIFIITFIYDIFMMFSKKKAKRTGNYLGGPG